MTVVLDRGEGGLPRRSMVNLSQVLTVAKERLQRRLGSLSANRMADVDRALKTALDLE